MEVMPAADIFIVIVFGNLIIEVKQILQLVIALKDDQSCTQLLKCTTEKNITTFIIQKLSVLSSIN